MHTSLVPFLRQGLLKLRLALNCVARDGFALLFSTTNLSPFPRITNCATRPTSFLNKVRVKPCQGASAGTTELLGLRGNCEPNTLTATLP